MRLALFTQGYFGARLLEKLEAQGVKPVVYTYAAASTRRKSDKYYLRGGYPLRYISERSYDPSLIEFSKNELIVCADWTKDFFHAAMPGVPVYHIHLSLLPKYRGYGAVSEQFLKGVAISGVTIYKDNCHIDSGDILFSTEIRISHNDYPLDFMEKAADISAEHLCSMLAGDFPAESPQSEELAIYAQRKRSRQGLIDFNMAALSVYNQIRAYSEPYFGSYFIYDGRQIKVWRALCESWAGMRGDAGKITARNADGVEIACGEGSVILTDIEIDGARYRNAAIGELL